MAIGPIYPTVESQQAHDASTLIKRVPLYPGAPTRFEPLVAVKNDARFAAGGGSQEDRAAQAAAFRQNPEYTMDKPNLNLPVYERRQIQKRLAEQQQTDQEYAQAIREQALGASLETGFSEPRGGRRAATGGTLSARSVMDATGRTFEALDRKVYTADEAMRQRTARDKFYAMFPKLVINRDIAPYKSLDEYTTDVVRKANEALGPDAKLIEGTMHAVAREYAPEGIKAEFALHDLRQKTFADWGVKTFGKTGGVDVTGDGKPETYFELWNMAREGNPNAMRIVQQYDEDLNAPHYDLNPADRKPTLRGLTPDQELKQQLKTARQTTEQATSFAVERAQPEAQQLNAEKLPLPTFRRTPAQPGQEGVMEFTLPVPEQPPRWRVNTLTGKPEETELFKAWKEQSYEPAVTLSKKISAAYAKKATLDKLYPEDSDLHTVDETSGEFMDYAQREQQTERTTQVFNARRMLRQLEAYKAGDDTIEATSAIGREYGTNPMTQEQIDERKTELRDYLRAMGVREKPSAGKANTADVEQKIEAIVQDAQNKRTTKGLPPLSAQDLERLRTGLRAQYGAK